MKLVKIAVDSGKYETKAMMAENNSKKDRIVKFRTLVADGSESFMTQNVINVKYCGKEYNIGEKQKRMLDNNSSKNTDIHKLCTYTAIAKLLEQAKIEEAEIIIAIGGPLDIVANRGQCKEYKENLLPLNTPIHITVDGKDKTFIFKNAFVFPETFGAIALHQKDYVDIPINIIDIGGLNVNGCQYENQKPQIQTMFTDNLGGNTLVEDIRNYLVKNDGAERGKLSDMLIESFLKNDNIRNLKSGDGKAVLKEIKLKKAKEILKACEAAGWDMKYTDTIFIGGTSQFLKDELSEAFNGFTIRFYEDATMANVRGFLMMIRYKQ